MVSGFKGGMFRDCRPSRIWGFRDFGISLCRHWELSVSGLKVLCSTGTQNSTVHKAFLPMLIVYVAFCNHLIYFHYCGVSDGTYSSDKSVGP